MSACVCLSCPGGGAVQPRKADCGENTYIETVNTTRVRHLSPFTFIATRPQTLLNKEEALSQQLPWLNNHSPRNLLLWSRVGIVFAAVAVHTQYRVRVCLLQQVLPLSQPRAKPHSFLNRPLAPRTG